MSVGPNDNQKNAKTFAEMKVELDRLFIQMGRSLEYWALLGLVSRSLSLAGETAAKDCPHQARIMLEEIASNAGFNLMEHEDFGRIVLMTDAVIIFAEARDIAEAEGRAVH